MIIFYVISVLLSLAVGLLVWRNARTVSLSDIILWTLTSLVPLLNLGIVVGVGLCYLSDVNDPEFKYPFKKDGKTS